MPSTAAALIAPLRAAVDRHRTRRALPTAMRTAELDLIPAELRDRAFFSAGVEDARTLDRMRALIDRALTLDTEAGPLVTRTTFIRDMRRLLGAVGLGDSGDLRDLTSRRRLALIYDMAVSEARGYAAYVRDMTGPGLDAFPAQELVRERAAVVPRDWFTRWEQAGGTYPAGGDRLVALKADPIWTAISRFGRPWPPFDFGSGMGLRDIPRAEAERHGLLRRGQSAPRATVPDFNRGVSIPSDHFSPAALDFLRTRLGDLVSVSGTEIRMA